MLISYKKLVIVIISVFSIIVAWFLYTGMYEIRVNDITISKNDYYNIMKSLIYDKNLNLKDIYINDSKLFYDKNNDMWYCSLIKGKGDLSNLKIRLALTNNEIKYKFLKPDWPLNNDFIKNNHFLELFLYTKNKYNVLRIRFTTLPIININFDENNMPERNKKVKMSFYLFDNEKGIDVLSDGFFELRGASTLVFPKKSYKINLTKESLGHHTRKNKISLLNMRKDDDWILYSPYGVHEKVANVFAMNLWHEMAYKNNVSNIPNASEYKFVELFLNHEYSGLYALSYPIDGKLQQIKPNLYGKYDEYIFKKNWWAHVEYESKKEPRFLWAYELRTKNKIKEKFSKGVTENDKLDYDKNHYPYNLEAWKVLNLFYTNLIKNSDVNKIYEISDIGNAIDMFLLINFLQSCDSVNRCNVESGLLKNIFITFKHYKNGYKAIYAPWDMEYILGTGFNDGPTPYSVRANQNFIFKTSPVWMLKTLGDKNIVRLVKSRYRNLRKTYWRKSHLLNLLNNYENEIYESGAYIREKKRWKHGLYLANNKGLQKIKRHLIKRIHYMDRYVNNFDI